MIMRLYIRTPVSSGYYLKCAVDWKVNASYYALSVSEVCVIDVCIVDSLFVHLFNFISIQERTGCSTRYCVPCCR